ncbi:hypothetical protein FSP39_000710 [Pinctada imbricata]|uniref:ATP-dependent DNA helicase n=1 Tax=Pinctada imbricata TaxID=66713 RepID=A0AA88XPT1_PINIB|nr:hypothetical protein FSP39_000710 [Pinctada imbricata]
MQLGDGAVTVHHWCGIGDGRYTPEFLSSNFMSDDIFQGARERIRKTDSLVIDVIGMASKKFFDMIELVCRLSKSSSNLFGGLQVIAAGDFKQLPPVPNYRYDDDGSYCFESLLFSDVFPHHINLKDALRQSEVALINAVHELCDGKPSTQTEAFLRSFDRDVQCQSVTRLFGTNFEVDYVNSLFLEENLGNEMIYLAVDTGDRHYLMKSGAPRKLILKVGAPVIATRNLPGICNGMQGVVAAIPDTGPVINFSGKLFTMTRVNFEFFDPKKSKVIASRSQYPVKLAYAMTIHRSQGMTINALEIDCHSIFQPGQLGVAVGRVTSSENLKIVNFSKNSATLKHPEKVYAFYFEESVEPKDDLSFCRKNYRIEFSIAEDDDDSDKGDGDSDNGTGCIIEADTKGDVYENTEDSDILICPYDCSQFLNENGNLSFLPVTMTENFISAVKLQSNILFTKLENFKSPSTSEEFNQFYGSLHMYLTSKEHLSTLETLKDSKKP